MQRKENELGRIEISVSEAGNTLTGKEIDIKRAELSLKKAEQEKEKQGLLIAEAGTRLTMKGIEKQETFNKLARTEQELSETSLKVKGIEIDIAEEEMRRLSNNLQALQTASDVLKIQLQIVESGLKRVDIDKDAAQTLKAIAETNKDIIAGRAIEVDLARAQVNLSEAQMQIEEERIRSQDVQIDTEKINIQTTELQLDDIELQKTTTFINRDIAEMGLESIKEDRLLAEKELITNEKALKDSLKQIPLKRKDVVDAEKEHLDTIETDLKDVYEKYSDMYPEELNMERATGGFDIDKLNQSTEETLSRYNERIQDSQTDYELKELEREPKQELTDIVVDEILDDAYFHKRIDTAMIDRMEQLMKAEIESTLIHEVGVA